jgi:Lysozyme like domain
MGYLTARQLAEYAARAGFRGADLQTSVAVALAEGKGTGTPLNRRVLAESVGDNGNSIGPWQIHMPSHPEFSRSYLLNPQNNANAARAVLRKQGWGAWTQFRNGAFLVYMPLAGANVKSLPGGIDTGDPLADKAAGVIDETAGGVLDTGRSVVAIGQLAAKAGTWISDPRNWMRIVYVALGGALVVGALVMVALPAATSVASPVVKAAVKATKS